MAGQAIFVSGLLAVVTSLLIATVVSRMDRRHVLIGLSCTMLASLLLIAMAPNFIVLMGARALLGITIGGFWALATATIMRLVPSQSVPKALGVLYTGNAVATAFAAPIGSFVGCLIGWRGVFWALAPLVFVNIAWQWLSLPAMPPDPTSRPLVPRAVRVRPQGWGGLVWGIQLIRTSEPKRPQSARIPPGKCKRRSRPGERSRDRCR